MSGRGERRLVGLLAVAVLGGLPVGAAGQPAPADGAVAHREVLQRYCFACHNDRTRTGGLALDALDLAEAGDHPEVWEAVVRKLRTGMMPPAGRPRPDAATIARLSTWLEATLDRAALAENIEHELVICEVCSAIVGTRKHLRWIAEKLGAKAYANPTLILVADGSMKLAAPAAGRQESPALARNDMMRVMCPDCRRTMVVHEIWGE